MENNSCQILVGEFIEMLSAFPKDMPITITDGFSSRCYDNTRFIALHEYEDTLCEICNEKKTYLDIGIGGLDLH